LAALWVLLTSNTVENASAPVLITELAGTSIECSQLSYALCAHARTIGADEVRP
jgi:hypothetical protein